MALRDDTRDLHHACEQHPVGAAMSDGTVDAQTWTDWLGCLATVHAALDPHVPVDLWRWSRLRLDLDEMRARGFTPRPNAAAETYAAILRPRDLPDFNPDAIRAATYVFTGAHLMGGAVMEKRLGERLPCAHLRWDDRRASLDLWRPYRECVGISAQARDAFGAILSMMDEIAGY